MESIGLLNGGSVGVTLRNAKLKSSPAPGLWSSYILLQTKRRAPASRLTLKLSVSSISYRITVMWVSFLAIFLDLCAEINTFLFWGEKRSGL